MGPVPRNPTTEYVKEAFIPIPGARATGRLARRPMARLPNMEPIAVEVIYSLLTSSMHYK
jgi:hypothetical protein